MVSVVDVFVGGIFVVVGAQQKMIKIMKIVMKK